MPKVLYLNTNNFLRYPDVYERFVYKGTGTKQYVKKEPTF